MSSAPDHVPEVRRALSDVAKVCAALGLERSTTERTKWRCPRHGGGSLNVRLGRDRTIQVKCFGCDFSGDVFSLIAETRGFNASGDFPKVLAEGARIGGLWGVVAELEAHPDARRTVGDPLPRRTRDATTVPVRPVNTPDRVLPPERPYPPSREVMRLWSSCVGVSAIRSVREMLERRALVPDDIDLFNLARALPEGIALPRWATYRGTRGAPQSWLELGYHLVLPVYDIHGVMRSLRAWRVAEGDGPKRLPPSGYRAGGLVMADAAATDILKTGACGIDRRVVIVEGEPDFLTWATRFSDGAETVPAVLGILSGSWTTELAARIPNNAQVIVRTHHDAAGDAYAAKIATTLVGRCAVLRSKGTP